MPKSVWNKPEITRFANADQMIAHYKSRASPDELAALERAIERAKASKNPEATRSKRRA